MTSGKILVWMFLSVVFLLSYELRIMKSLFFAIVIPSMELSDLHIIIVNKLVLVEK